MGVPLLVRRAREGEGLARGRAALRGAAGHAGGGGRVAGRARPARHRRRRRPPAAGRDPRRARARVATGGGVRGRCLRAIVPPGSPRGPITPRGVPGRSLGGRTLLTAAIVRPSAKGQPDADGNAMSTLVWRQRDRVTSVTRRYQL